MNDQDSGNVGTKHPSGVGTESPRPAQSEGLAGRELDRQVAERVFGIKKIFRPCDVKTRDDYWWSPEEYHYHYIPSGKPPRTHMIDAKIIPYFSTDIDAAMEVAEKMRERGYFPCLWAAQLWNVEFWDEDHQFAGSRSEDSLPEAICRAALAAVALNEPARDAETTTVG